jgi:hypothetical protein
LKKFFIKHDEMSIVVTWSSLIVVYPYSVVNLWNKKVFIW